MGRPLRPLGLLLAGIGTLVLTACGSAGPVDIARTAASYSAGPPQVQVSAPLPTAATATPTGPSAAARPAVHVVRTVAKDLRVPWGIARLPNGRVLVGSRDTGRIYRIDLATRHRVTVGRVAGAVSNVAQGGEAGLLGIALSPAFARDHRLYVYFSTRTDNRIAWLRYRPRHLGRPHVIVRGIPHGVHHDGGRIAFGPDGLLYAGTGEIQHPWLAQRTSSLGGKILRMTPSGRPAPGNPFGTLVYTYGHRNVQGLAFDPQGRLWASELGDHTADELNLIRAGRNYGWPATQGKTSNPAYTSPVVQWGTAEDSPSGIAYADGAIWMAALHGQRLWRIPLHGDTAGKPRDFLVGAFGRLRSVLALDEHHLLVTTSNRDGRAPAHRHDDKVILLRVR